ncbi:MAG: DUF1345 domain-containing protein [Verrucomicrobia bacterium]|nr:DUF1345 domain-containing protein [Verrucomicrobiota bacterium]
MKDNPFALRTFRAEPPHHRPNFLFVILAAVTSLFAVAILVGGAKGLGPRALTEHLVLAGATVLSSWFLVHTVFAMHYAHTYYHDSDNDPHNRRRRT